MYEFIKTNLAWLAPALGGIIVIAYPYVARILGYAKSFLPSRAPSPPAADAPKATTSLDAVHDALRVLYAQHLEIGVTPEQADAWLREGMMRAINGAAK